jgi:hypothetical protein
VSAESDEDLRAQWNRDTCVGRCPSSDGGGRLVPGAEREAGGRTVRRARCVQSAPIEVEPPAPDLLEDPQVTRVRGLAACDALLELLAVARAKRVTQASGQPVNAAERHARECGHELRRGCCRGSVA